MSRPSDVEHTLHAWETFRDIAKATRTLAASRAGRAREHVAHTQRYLGACNRLLSCLDATPLSAPVMVAIGTDLGLCGALNRVVAEHRIEGFTHALRKARQARVTAQTLEAWQGRRGHSVTSW